MLRTPTATPTSLRLNETCFSLWRRNQPQRSANKKRLRSFPAFSCSAWIRLSTETFSSLQHLSEISKKVELKQMTEWWWMIIITNYRCDDDGLWNNKLLLLIIPVCDFFDANTNRYRVPHQFMQFYHPLQWTPTWQQQQQMRLSRTRECARQVEMEMCNCACKRRCISDKIGTKVIEKCFNCVKLLRLIAHSVREKTT